jgi:hypothetical protein
MAQSQLANRLICLVVLRLAASPTDGAPGRSGFAKLVLQPVVKREHAGANSIIGVNAVAKAAYLAHSVASAAYAANTTYPASLQPRTWSVSSLSVSHAAAE